jgi:hypothetical protein
MKQRSEEKNMVLTSQQMKLISAAVEIGKQSPDEIEPAFMAWQLVQATLPHTDPGDVPSWWRKNGALTLTVTPGYDADKCLGYPYGIIPRLLLFWIVTEAIRTKSRRLELGTSLAKFMRELGLDPERGGKRSDASRLREQMIRLFRASISFSMDKIEGRKCGMGWLNMQVAPDGVLWWDEKTPEQPCLFGSWIELSDKFFDAICSAPVPVDMKALHALKRSPLALDLYAWTSYAAFAATRAEQARFVSWELLMRQLGCDYSNADDFRRKAKAALRKIKVIYPGLKIGDAQGGIEVLPGASAVRPKKAYRAAAEALA